MLNMGSKSRDTVSTGRAKKGEVDESQRDKKLKEKFLRGIRSDKLRMATRVSYESSDTHCATAHEI
ncbi:hypothetical protein DPMN_052390 [Dreissena polymorpha]|uniref:Uncharacterized protein n=1 Tax=Dreissena polymorpha TaxID=45954 RepID=A0A9D4HR83_DREPO|nr:hypothetical protein DPMN_052390 [Dreissena polymorpha]